ncbi:MAG: ABC transporter permease [Streptosporangiaceae bacterium]
MTKFATTPYSPGPQLQIRATAVSIKQCPIRLIGLAKKKRMAVSLKMASRGNNRAKPEKWNDSADAQDLQSWGPSGGSRRLLREAFGKQAFILLLFYIVILFVFSLANTQFFTAVNIINVVSTSGILMLVTTGQALTIISGGFDLSVGGVVPLAAVIFALLSAKIPLILLTMLVMIVGALVGIINSGLVTLLRVNPLIATLGMLSVTGGIALALANGLTVSVAASAGVLGNNGPGNIPYFMYLVVIVIVIAAVMLRWTGIGRRLYVVGGNPEAARLAGIRVGSVRMIAYATSGMLAALAGVVYASQLLSATGDVGSNTTLSSIAAAVLGGASLAGGEGGMGGVVLGVLVLGTVQNGLSIMRIPGFYETIATGVILLIAMSGGRLRGVGEISQYLRRRPRDGLQASQRAAEAAQE